MEISVYKFLRYPASMTEINKEAKNQFGCVHRTASTITCMLVLIDVTQDEIIHIKTISVDTPGNDASMFTLSQPCAWRGLRQAESFRLIYLQIQVAISVRLAHVRPQQPKR